MIGKNEGGKMKGFTGMQLMIMMICGLLVVLFLLGSYIGGESGYMDYTYTTGLNSTATPYLNTSVNGTQSLIIGNIARTISGETRTETIDIMVDNTDTTNRIITVYLNSAVIGNITAINQSNSSTLFNIDYTQNSKNTLLFVPVANVGSDLRIINATGVYPNDVEDIKSELFISLMAMIMTIIIILALIIRIIPAKM